MNFTHIQSCLHFDIGCREHSHNGVQLSKVEAGTIGTWFCSDTGRPEYSSSLLAISYSDSRHCIRLVSGWTKDQP